MKERKNRNNRAGYKKPHLLAYTEDTSEKLRNSKRKRNTTKLTLTSANELEKYKTDRKKVNARNKERSKTMEREIAKYLRGRRTPASGAYSSWKSDVEVAFEHFPGKYIIECKMTDSKKPNGNKEMYINFQWFHKLQEEVKAMNARFGVLILHFLGVNYVNDYVFIRSEDLGYITTILHTPYAEDIVNTNNKLNSDLGSFLLDLQKKKNGEYRSGYSVRQMAFEQIFKSLEGFVMPYFKCIIPGNIRKGDYEPRQYIVMRLKDFHTLLEHT